MKNNKLHYHLTTIDPASTQGASVLSAGEGFMGPFFAGNGQIDLLCGACDHALCTGMQPGQIQTLVFVCPNCATYNAVLSIPALEHFVSHLQANPAAASYIPDLAAALHQAQEKKHSPADLVAYIEEKLPDLSSVKELLIPHTSGDFYGLIGCVLAFLAWYQSRKPVKQSPQVIINNFYSGSDA